MEYEGTPHRYALNTLKTIRELTRDNQNTPMTAREYQFLITLLTYRNNVTYLCNPTIKRVAEDMKCARSTAQSAMEGLRKKGYIKTTTKYNQYAKKKSSNQHWIMHDFETIRLAFEDDDAREFFEIHHEDIVEMYEDYLLKYETN